MKRMRWISGIGRRRSCWPRSRRRLRRPPRRPKAPKLSGHDHGVGRGVAHRGVHQDGHRLPEDEQGHDGHVQLRGVVHARHADPGRRAGRRVRVGRRRQHAEAGVGRPGHRRAGRLRSNLLTIVVKPGNPKNVKSLADLANVGVVSLCAPTVPCGKYAAQVAAARTASRSRPRRSRSGATSRPRSPPSPPVTPTPAIVYVTDAKTPGRRSRRSRSPRRRT